LIDHANCEKKAAGTALSLLYRYVDKPELLRRMSRLAREELRHYEQVLSTMDAVDLEYGPLTPGRYAGAMRALIRTSEPGRLVDTLLVGAVVEARSCERLRDSQRGSKVASLRSTTTAGVGSAPRRRLSQSRAPLRKR
jgi:tRNA-(ms[2]io[6]A)-hydroxylase